MSREHVGAWMNKVHMNAYHGDDVAGDGTPEHPFKTLPVALAALGEGGGQVQVAPPPKKNPDPYGFWRTVGPSLVLIGCLIGSWAFLYGIYLWMGR